jgi:methionine synthase II (cobalamin-independent)
LLSELLTLFEIQADTIFIFAKKTMKPEITKEIYIEDLVNHYPFTITYLMRKGIRCIACGEPVWGTLKEAVKEKGFTEGELENFIAEMKELAKTA